MKTTFVAISSQDWQQIRPSLFSSDGCENAGALLCGLADAESELRLLVRRFIPVPPELYIKRNAYHLEVSPRFYNHVVDECLRDSLSPVLIHSHPHHKDAWYSSSDDFGESHLLRVLDCLLPGKVPASLVATPASFAGRRFIQGKFVSIAGLKEFGQTSRIVSFDERRTEQYSDRFDRQVRAFGAEGQQLLHSLKIGIVGVGGIGSIVLEQLVRLGIDDLLIVDNDVIEASNLNRLFGTTKRDIGKRKADVSAQYAKRLGSRKVVSVPDSAIRQSVLSALRDRDLIFSCVDNDRTRSLLNRFSYQYLVPIVELGTRLDARDGSMQAAAGRVVIVGAGMSCLRCSHHLNAERIRAESLPEAERRELQKEGYVIGIDEPAPAVVSLNTVVAGLGVTAGINLFVRLTGGVQPLSQMYDATNGSVFTVADVHEPQCDICDKKLGITALGDSQIVSAYS